jgi:hypothetical protein
MESAGISVGGVGERRAGEVKMNGGKKDGKEEQSVPPKSRGTRE